MRTQKAILTLALSAISLLGLVQCGNAKSKSENAFVTVSPEIPIVITADITDGATGAKLVGPWFKFQVKIENKTAQSFEIVTMQADISGIDKSGIQSTRTVAFDPAAFNFSQGDLQCKYVTYGTWAVNENREVVPQNSGSCAVTKAFFYVGSNPSGPSGKSFRYRIKLKPIGYFVDSLGNPEDRFEKFKYFFTQ